MSGKHLIVLIIGVPLLAKVLFAILLGSLAVSLSATAITVMADAGGSLPGPLTGAVIAIDPGHGGGDGGVTAAGLVEKEINLEAAFALRDVILDRGGTSVLTRQGDEEYAPSNRDELDHRLRLASEQGAHLFVSLHTNSFPDGGQFGAQTFFNPHRSDSQTLALLIQEELVRLQPDNYREAHPAEFYVLINSNSPSVLLEMGFLTNPGDRGRLTNPDYLKEMSGAIATAIERYIAHRKPREGAIHGPPFREAPSDPAPPASPPQ